MPSTSTLSPTRTAYAILREAPPRLCSSMTRRLHFVELEVPSLPQQHLTLNSLCTQASAQTVPYRPPSSTIGERLTHNTHKRTTHDCRPFRRVDSAFAGFRSATSSKCCLSEQSLFQNRTLRTCWPQLMMIGTKFALFLITCSTAPAPNNVTMRPTASSLFA